MEFEKLGTTANVEVNEESVKAYKHEDIVLERSILPWKYFIRKTGQNKRKQFSVTF